MIVKLVGCDNPACNQTGEPTRMTNRSHSVPDDWFRSKVLTPWGETLTVETCSRECISPAVIAANYREVNNA